LVTDSPDKLHGLENSEQLHNTERLELIQKLNHRSDVVSNLKTFQGTSAANM
jgi:hypothetical protein